MPLAIVRMKGCSFYDYGSGVSSNSITVSACICSCIIYMHACEWYMHIYNSTFKIWNWHKSILHSWNTCEAAKFWLGLSSVNKDTILDLAVGLLVANVWNMFSQVAALHAGQLIIYEVLTIRTCLLLSKNNSLAIHYRVNRRSGKLPAWYLGHLSCKWHQRTKCLDDALRNKFSANLPVVQRKTACKQMAQQNYIRHRFHANILFWKDNHRGVTFTYHESALFNGWGLAMLHFLHKICKYMCILPCI